MVAYIVEGTPSTQLKDTVMPEMLVACEKDSHKLIITHFRQKYNTPCMQSENHNRGCRVRGRIPPSQVGNHSVIYILPDRKLSAKINSLQSAKTVRLRSSPFGIAERNLICSLHALGGRLLTPHSATLQDNRRRLVVFPEGFEPSTWFHTPTIMRGFVIMWYLNFTMRTWNFTIELYHYYSIQKIKSQA